MYTIKPLEWDDTGQDIYYANGVDNILYSIVGLAGGKYKYTIEYEDGKERSGYRSSLEEAKAVCEKSYISRMEDWLIKIA